ncbi:hypothetical protein DKX38_012035 [Salix brachista]|uniref:Uncharacterized protein n=1 Tax=Salix brachista TaxID=2182728 RepID=A0A5N5LMI6_9ROSI|nr:hypothetical protein DKX38_012035 [Salix brachista]
MWIRYSHASQTAELTVTDTRDLKIKLEDDSGGLPFHIMRVNKAFKVPSFNCGCQISLGMSISRRSIQLFCSDLMGRIMKSIMEMRLEMNWIRCTRAVPFTSYLQRMRATPLNFCYLCIAKSERCAQQLMKERAGVHGDQVSKWKFEA